MTVPRKRRPKAPKRVESFRHEEAKRPNLPSAEHQSVMSAEDQTPIRSAIERRNLDLDPQLVWRGKDDGESFEVQAPPLFIQEKVHPKALIDDLKRVAAQGKAPEDQVSLFDDFNGLPSAEARTEFYQHDANWSNRMILGDSLQVMASLADREGLRGKVQCIYIDPPYGIKFNSNFQWSTTSRDVKDGKGGPHHPGTGAGQGVSGHLAGRNPLLPELPAGPVDGGAGAADREWVGVRADRG